MSREAEAGSTQVSVNAICGAGQVALGGGFTVAGNGQDIAKVVENAPFSAAEVRRHGSPLHPKSP